MEGQNVPQLSELQQKIVAAREESKTRVIEKDANRLAVKEAKKTERDAKRAEREKNFKDTVDKAKNKVKEYRAKDKEYLLKRIADIDATPKIAEIVVKTGAEVSKKFVIEKKNEVVDTAKKIEQGVERKGIEIKTAVIETSESIKRNVNRGIENTVQAYVDTKTEIGNAFVEAGLKVNEQVTKGKEAVVKAWKRVQAVPLDVRANMEEKKAIKTGERIDRDIAKYAEMSAKINECRNKAAELKGAKNSIAREFASA